MSVAVKRKRGRPRLDEPKEIKDFDLNLIEEFKKFPVFYDRQHPQHRNRECTDRIWLRIAQNLNVSTNLVKTRMLQLRNRFNLEKRRVEAMRHQSHSSVSSHWSLYERLSFLSDYVKTRRPYSLPINHNPKANSTATSSDANEEDDQEDDEDTHTQVTSFKSKHILTNGNILNNNKQTDENYRTHQKHSTTAAALQQVKPVEVNNEFLNKYKAFGQFLASSLIEMNEIQALRLVEKFTTELVKCLKTEERKEHYIKISQSNNTFNDDENVIY